MNFAPKKVGFVASAFDLCHAGHLAMLKEAKEHCNFLIVALHTDPTIDRPETKSKPIETVFERWVRLDACKNVDKIIPYDTEADLFNLLAIIKPDVRFLGTDYVGKDYTGRELNIEIVYLKRMHNFSSTNLRDRIKKP